MEYLRFVESVPKSHNKGFFIYKARENESPQVLLSTNGLFYLFLKLKHSYAFHILNGM